MGVRDRRFVGASGAALLLFMAASHARAQGANDAAAAEALFNEGKRLMAAKQLSAACSKFAESQRLDPGVGTVLWLADCYSQNGQLASAWATFKEAEGLAKKLRDPRATLARDEASKLEPKLSKLVIDVTGATASEGLEIRRDGVVLGRPLWGTLMPTDPGSHKVAASAPRKKTWVGEIAVPRDGGSAILRIPTLEDAPAESKPSEGAPRPEGDEGTGNTQRIVGLTVIGVGVIGVVVGTIFGLSVKSKNDESQAHCVGNRCDQTGYDARKAALSAATLSTISFVVGGVALAGGTVLYFTAPRRAGAVSLGVTGAPLYGGAGAFLVGTLP